MKLKALATVLPLILSSAYSYAGDQATLKDIISANDVDDLRGFLLENPDINLIKDLAGDISALDLAIQMKHQRAAIILAQHNNYQYEKRKLNESIALLEEYAAKLEELEASISVSATKANEELLIKEKNSVLEQMMFLESQIEESKATLSHNEEPQEDEVVQELLKNGVISRIDMLESQLREISDKLKANDKVAETVFKNIDKNQKPLLSYEVKKE
ncbi:exported hypothetical protein [Vibrio chagasii]|nr:exported hypothetical protein [Vibrio chagasii]